MKKIIYALGFWLLLTATVFGQITVPAEVKWGDPIVAVVNPNMPEGASFVGGWKIPDTVGMYQFDNKTVGLWPAAKGKYTISYAGFWIHLQDVTFIDNAGNTITIKSYLGHGLVDEKATFEVKEGPDPGPGPGPLPIGKKQLMLFYEADKLDDYPEAQRQILTSRQFRNTLQTQEHVLHEIVEAAALNQQNISEEKKLWFSKVKGLSLPVVALAPKDGGTIKVLPLPANINALLSILNNGGT